jgi:TonB family protein
MRLGLLMLIAFVCSAQNSGDATSLLSRVANAARTTNAWLIEGSSTIENGSGGDPVGNFRLAWRTPNLARYVSGGAGLGRALVVCDGSTVWTYHPNANHYTKVANRTSNSPSASDTADAQSAACSFFTADWKNLLAGITSATFVGRDTLEVNGAFRDCEVVRVEYPAERTSPSGLRSRVLCIDPDQLFILREQLVTDHRSTNISSGVPKVETRTYRLIRHDPRLDSSLFVFTPPDGSTATELPRVYKLSEGIAPPVLIQRRDPEYTKNAITAGVEGVVLLEVEIGVDGRAHNVRVIRSLDPGLDSKAVECVEAWRFRPGTRDGEPVTVAANIEIAFRLVDR